MAAMSLAARAEEDPVETISPLRFNGFGTVGLTRLSNAPGWGFRRGTSQPYNDGGTRADTDTSLGLQLNYTVNPQLEFVGQVLLRRRPSSSVPLDSLEWAFASYRATDNTTIRVGRTAPDFFLISDHRNVGFAYPWVRPNSEAYSLLPIFSTNGADITHHWDLGDVRWSAKLFAGAGSTRLSVGTPNDATYKMKSLYGGVLSREEGGLMLRATLARSQGGLQNLPLVDQLDAGLASLEKLPVPQVAAEATQLRSLSGYGNGYINYLAAGVAYEAGPWIINAEFMRLNSDLAYARTQFAYVGVARRFGAVSIFGMTGSARSNAPVPTVPQWQAQLAPLVGPALAAQAQALGTVAAYVGNARVYQRSLSVGARWDLHPQIALKLQLDHFRIDANGGANWGNQSKDAASPNVVSATMDFVF